MKFNTIKEEETFYGKVFDLLEKKGGMYINVKDREYYRDDFIKSHLSNKKHPCSEWRFKGKFGFGGKYRSETNKIDYYIEDKTDELDLLRDKINHELSLIKDNIVNAVE